MRLFSALFGRGSAPQNPNKVPLSKPRLYFRTRDRVSTKALKSVGMPCVQELQNLISKLAVNDYNQQFCKKEFDVLTAENQRVYKQFLDEKAENRSGVIKPGMKLNPVPLNKYLKRFPVAKKNKFEEKLPTIPLWKKLHW